MNAYEICFAISLTKICCWNINLADNNNVIPSKSAAISSMPLTPSIMDKIMSVDSIPEARKFSYTNVCLGIDNALRLTCIWIQFYIPSEVPLRTIELISKFSSSHVSVDCQFARSLSASISNPKLISVNLLITNICSDVLHDVRIISDLSASNLDSSSKIGDFLVLEDRG